MNDEIFVNRMVEVQLPQAITRKVLRDATQRNKKL